MLAEREKKRENPPTQAVAAGMECRRGTASSKP